MCNYFKKKYREATNGGKRIHHFFKSKFTLILTSSVVALVTAGVIINSYLISTLKAHNTNYQVYVFHYFNSTEKDDKYLEKARYHFSKYSNIEYKIFRTYLSAESGSFDIALKYRLIESKSGAQSSLANYQVDTMSVFVDPFMHYRVVYTDDLDEFPNIYKWMKWNVV